MPRFENENNQNHAKGDNRVSQYRNYKPSAKAVKSRCKPLQTQTAVGRSVASIFSWAAEKEQLLEAVKAGKGLTCIHCKASVGANVRDVMRPRCKECDAELDRRLASLAERLVEGPVGFPTHAFPSYASELIQSGARSIHCAEDLLAVPMLAVAGAAIGRSGLRLKVKDGWVTSSCLWAVVMCESSGGKTPALNLVQQFFVNRQTVEYMEWKEHKDAFDDDPENHPRPGPCPTLMLTDTTAESLKADLQQGPVLYTNDELAGWSHSMGQYKGGQGGEKFMWCSFWSHTPVNVGRKASDRVFIPKPFVAVTGMLVPACARELNYRGHSDDGFVHRMLIGCPRAMPPRATLEGVPPELANEYDQRMSRLFEPPEGESMLSFDPEALQVVLDWANEELYAELRALDVAPAYLESKYKKLYENCYRVCLVLHGMWMVSPEEERTAEWENWGYGDVHREFRHDRIDVVTASKAIAVINYFRAHIPHMVALMGETVDEVDRHFQRLCGRKALTVRQAIHAKVGRNKDAVLEVFAAWDRRGYGSIDQTRKNQTTFVFGTATDD